MEQDSEKEYPRVCHDVEVSAQPVEAPRDDALLKKSYRKVDCRLLTWYAFVCLLMRIASHNITNAAIMNIEVSILDCLLRIRLTRVHCWNRRVRISSINLATCRASSGLWY